MFTALSRLRATWSAEVNLSRRKPGNDGWDVGSDVSRNKSLWELPSGSPADRTRCELTGTKSARKADGPIKGRNLAKMFFDR